MRALPILLLLAGAAYADEPKAQAPHQEGDYGGVQPGTPTKPDPAKKPKKPPPKGTLAWIGFEVKDGSSVLFLQSVAPFTVAQTVDNGTLVLELGDLVRLGQNTWRPIDTRFFDTPLARVAAKRVGASKGKNPHPAGIEVRVTFKNPKDAKEGAARTSTEPDGFFYTYLTFTGGSPGGTGSAAAPTQQDPEK